MRDRGETRGIDFLGRQEESSRETHATKAERFGWELDNTNRRSHKFQVIAVSLKRRVLCRENGLRDRTAKF